MGDAFKCGKPSEQHQIVDEKTSYDLIDLSLVTHRGVFISEV